MAAQARRIVVGFDGSPTAWRALDAAAGLIGYGSTLTVVTVATESVSSDTALGEARERLLDQQVQARYVQAVGDPAEELVAAARELDADLVVVGRHNRGRAGGSLDAALLRLAPCDVLVVSDQS